jgi:DNA-binding GntR family transcriptional regulator
MKNKDEILKQIKSIKRQKRHAIANKNYSKYNELDKQMILLLWVLSPTNHLAQ